MVTPPQASDAVPVEERRQKALETLRTLVRAYVPWGTSDSAASEAALDALCGAGLSADQLWRPIDSAPKDGTEVLAWREDCGVMMARYTCANNLSTITDKERDELDEESLFQEDWFGGDSELGGFRLEGSEVPSHWKPLPPAPGASPAAAPSVGLTEEKLWCVHVWGPDDLYPEPSKAAALEHANALNIAFGKRPRHEYDPIVLAVVVEWPYTPESHAEGVERALIAQQGKKE